MDTSSFIALNPDKKPGSIVLAGSMAARGNLGSQVACKLSLEHFVDGVFEYFDSGQQALSPSGQRPEKSLGILETAFRRANNSVYSFGHKLAAGGRMAASLIGVVISDGMVAAGRVGQGSAFLYRSGEVFPFFENAFERENVQDEFVGANSLISVELASVDLHPNDLVILFSTELDQEKTSQLGRTLRRANLDTPSLQQELNSKDFDDLGDLAFSLACRLGPDTIYLDRNLYLNGRH